MLLRKYRMVATKAWFKKHQQAKIAIKDRELLTKAVNFYLASLRPEATIAPVEAYRRVTQTLGKRKSALVQIFHTEIQNTVFFLRFILQSHAPPSL